MPKWFDQPPVSKHLPSNQGLLSHYIVFIKMTFNLLSFIQVSSVSILRLSEPTEQVDQDCTTSPPPLDQSNYYWYQQFNQPPTHYDYSSYYESGWMFSDLPACYPCDYDQNYHQQWGQYGNDWNGQVVHAFQDEFDFCTAY